LFLCWDGPGADALRDRDLEAHLAHAEAHWRSLLVAGPMKEGDRIVGSLFMVLAETEEAAWALMRQDPYFTNGQYREVAVRPFTPGIGMALGGRIWPDASALRAVTSQAQTGAGA
jgi:uncharacterized protein YciI